MAQGNPEGIKAAYEQVCKAHGEISEFRAKLLAILPIASGAGIFLLLNDKLTPAIESHLLGIGVFGALVTLGLFLHELRGIQICIALVECGKSLEERLLRTKRGRFYDSPRPILRSFIGATWGAVIIYSSVIAAWSYVACIGYYGLGNALPARGISIGVLISTVLFGALTSWKQRKDVWSRCLDELPSSLEETAKDTDAEPHAT